MSQVPVKWVHPTGLLNQNHANRMAVEHIPVVPLSALREFLVNVRTHLLVGYTEDMDEIVAIDRLLASLGEVGK